MSLYIGNDKLGSLYLGSTKIKEAWVGDVKVYGSGDPYNPLNLPPFTIRCKFAQGYTPHPDWTVTWDSLNIVDQVENVWDITKNSTDWNLLLVGQSRLFEVLGANTTGVTNMSNMFSLCNRLTNVEIFDTRSCTSMSSMFRYCSSITSVPLFDTSSCTEMFNMFNSCTSLTSVPLFDTSSCTDMTGMFSACQSIVTVPLFDTSHVTNMSKMFSLEVTLGTEYSILTHVPLFDTHLVTDMSEMFDSCYSLTSVPLFDTSSCTNIDRIFRSCSGVESGALSFYNQVSSQITVPSHRASFEYCGIDTPTGLAELQQIPSSWGGLAPG